MDAFTWTVVAFCIGATLGGFFHTLVWRLYRMESPADPSRCPECRRVLPWRDQIPLASWWFLDRKCRYCRKPISGAYPLIEGASGAVFSLLTLRALEGVGAGGFHASSLFALFFAFFLASVLFIVIDSDARFQLIYDIVILPSIAVVFLARLFLGAGFFDMLLGAALGFAFFGVQYWLSDGRAIGFGDVKLGVLLGLAFGLLPLVYLLVLAYVLGSATGLLLLLRKQKKLSSTLPLGVFLGIAGLVLLVFGTRPIERLLGL